MSTRIWLTFKQHRFETIAITVLCLGLAVAGVVEAFRLYALNTPAACLANCMGPYFSGPISTNGPSPTVNDPRQAASDDRHRLTSSFDICPGRIQTLSA